MINPPTREYLTRLAGRTVAAGSAVVLAASTWATWSPSFLDAATNAGTAQIVEPVDSPNAGQPLESGGGMTPFSLALPFLAACTGDSANSFYLIQSYMVPADVDPATLKYNANGPVPADVGANFRQPLYDNFGSPYVQQLTAPQDTPGGPGLIINIPPGGFNFAVFAEGDYILPGTYNVGIACTKGPQDEPNQLDKYWNTQMTFTEDPTDPVGVKWTSTGGPPTTTPTTTTTVPPTTTVPTTTTPTTTAPPTTAPTTTVPPTTTPTTTAPPTTTTIVPPPTTTVPPTTTFQPDVLAEDVDMPDSTTGGKSGPTGGGLPPTGASMRLLMLWAGLLGVLGLAASALGRESPRGGTGKRAS